MQMRRAEGRGDGVINGNWMTQTREHMQRLGPIIYVPKQTWLYSRASLSIFTSLHPPYHFFPLFLFLLHGWDGLDYIFFFHFNFLISTLRGFSFLVLNEINGISFDSLFSLFSFLFLFIHSFLLSNVFSL